MSQQFAKTIRRLPRFGTRTTWSSSRHVGLPLMSAPKAGWLPVAALEKATAERIIDCAADDSSGGYALGSPEYVP